MKQDNALASEDNRIYGTNNLPPTKTQAETWDMAPTRVRTSCVRLHTTPQRAKITTLTPAPPRMLTRITSIHQYRRNNHLDDLVSVLVLYRSDIRLQRLRRLLGELLR